MTRSVLAVGLDPVSVDPRELGAFTPQMVREFLSAQLLRVREAGYAVELCLLDPHHSPESLLGARLAERAYDCVLLEAGLRAPARLLLFERLVNLIHEQAPRSHLCFNRSPADSLEAVQRWI